MAFKTNKKNYKYRPISRSKVPKNLRKRITRTPSNSSRRVLRKFLVDRKRSTKGANYKRNERNIMADGSLEELLEVHEKESIDELFEEVFKDLSECQKSPDKMKAGKTSTPTSRTVSRGLVPQG